jgi:hypothetical protein
MIVIVARKRDAAYMRFPHRNPPVVYGVIVGESVGKTCKAGEM